MASQIQGNEVLLRNQAVFEHQLQFLDEDLKDSCRKAAEMFNAFQGEVTIAQILDTDLTALAFNVPSGEWIFTETLDLHKTQIKWEEGAKWIVAGTAIGAAGGAAAGFMVFKNISYIPLVAEKGQETVVAIGAVAGALCGMAWGWDHAAKKFHIRMKKVELDIESKRVHVDRNVRSIMQTLFNSVAGGSPHITCPISGELLQLPVDAGCKLERDKKPHIFEYSNIKRVVEQKGRCPICNRKITLADLRVDSKKRREVSLTIELSIRYLTSRKPKKHSIDVLDKKRSFLENPDEIIGKIEAEDLDGPELDFISGLVRERIEWYNARIDITRRLLLDHLAQKIKELGGRQFLNFTANLSFGFI